MYFHWQCQNPEKINIMYRSCFNFSLQNTASFSGILHSHFILLPTGNQVLLITPLTTWCTACSDFKLCPFKTPPKKAFIHTNHQRVSQDTQRPLSDVTFSTRLSQVRHGHRNSRSPARSPAGLSQNIVLKVGARFG